MPAARGRVHAPGSGAAVEGGGPALDRGDVLRHVEAAEERDLAEEGGADEERDQPHIAPAPARRLGLRVGALHLCSAGTAPPVASPMAAMGGAVGRSGGAGEERRDEMRGEGEVGGVVRVGQIGRAHV